MHSIEQKIANEIRFDANRINYKPLHPLVTRELTPSFNRHFERTYFPRYPAIVIHENSHSFAAALAVNISERSRRGSIFKGQLRRRKGSNKNRRATVRSTYEPRGRSRGFVCIVDNTLRVHYAGVAGAGWTGG